ncbi:MAG: hypothetical protein SFW36_21980 [Leptolyngbyaceae cyanobacterium bins.59]|nr:hypothetical protein [Leptolyngbyaceae cyanobacterium bins.59]
MSNQSVSQVSQSHTELEFVQKILEMDSSDYPWNPTSLEAEAYFDRLEQDFSLADWQGEEIGQRSQAFMKQIDQLWVQQSLVERFALRMPKEMVQKIFNRAEQLVSSQMSLIDQLVQCVQEALPNWGEDDLQVLARPLAFAMRGSEAVDATLQAVQSMEWSDLSEVEQARLSLAAAHQTLMELKQQNSADQSPA